ncbi:MAG: hypothetical protein HZA89_00640 [Verrucomicrobia bacterium]|nr:hypothetical protein [Verrucomicrobiota bacterium]
MKISLQQTVANARTMREMFAQAVRGEPYELKGMLFSEVLFILAALQGRDVLRFFESGRGRGQSTLLLGKLLPHATVISYEIDPLSADVDIAARRLQPLTNVRQCFGNSIQIFPRILKEGDIVLIDGPKSYRAVRLALQCLHTGKPAAVFIHDVYQSLGERRFLERHLPEAFFSDDREFVELTRSLDDPCWRTLEEQLPGQIRPYGYGTGATRSYGFTVACIPRGERDYRGLLMRASLDGGINRLRQTLLKQTASA